MRSDPPPDVPLVVHVGFPHTAAETLQQALGRLGPQLHRHGIGVVDHDAVAALDARHGWQRELVADADAACGFEAELGQLIADAAARAARGSGAPARAVILSSEHFLGRAPVDGREAGRLRPLAVPAVAQAVRASGATRVRLVCYVRRPDRVMELSYLQAIQQGGIHPFAHQFPRLDEPVVDYAGLLTRLAELPEVVDVRVRPVEALAGSPARYADDLLATVGLAGRLDLAAADADRPPIRYYTDRALGLALDVNRYLDTAQERHRMREFLLTNFGADVAHAARPLTDQARGRILAVHAAGIRELFARYLPELPAEAYTDPDATAQLGASPAPAADAAPTPDAPADDAPAAAPVAPGVAAPRHRLIHRSTVWRQWQAATADLVIVSPPGSGCGWLRLMLGIALARHSGVRPHDPLRLTDGGVAASRLPRIVAAGPLRPAALRPHRLLGLRGVKVVVVAGEPTAPPAATAAPAGDDLGPWLAFYDAWARERHRRPDDVTVVRYAELCADPAAVVERVLHLAGAGPVDPGVVRRAVEESAFDQLHAPRSGP